MIAQQKYFVIVLYILPLVFSNGYLSAMPISVLNTKNYSISWIQEISTESDIVEKTNFWGNLFQRIVGKKETAFIKPISIYGQIDDQIYILDQGLRAITFINIPKKKIFGK